MNKDEYCPIAKHGKMIRLGSGRLWCPHSDHDSVRQVGVWKVIAYKGNHKFYKSFTGDKPSESGAVDYAKALAQNGYSKINIVSVGRAFRKPPSVIVPKGYVWCCYCLKPRIFKEIALRQRDGGISPKVFRCPICHASIRDAYIRDNNNFLIIAQLDPRAQSRKKKLPSEKAIRSAMAGR